MPIYNAEKYLPACIESILAQTFIDFELILINDASNDNSLLICNQYAKKDNRILVLNQEKNGGECVSRNIGIDIARGRYIVNIDADDQVLRNHLESLYFSSKIQSGTLVHAPHLKSRNGVINDLRNRTYGPCFIENLFKNENNNFSFLFAGPAWSKLLETDIIRSNNVRFRPGIKINGDHIFHLEYLMYVKSYKNVGVSTYVYFYNTDSISKKYFSFEECFERVQIMIPLTQTVLERFSIQDKLTQKNLYLTPINALISSIFALYRLPFRKNKIERINCLSLVLENYRNYLNDYWLPTDFKNKALKNVLKFRNIYLIDFFLDVIILFKYSLLIKISKSFF